MGFPNHHNTTCLNVLKPITPLEVYFRVWQKWGALDDIALSWPFILLGNLVVEREDDPPKIQDYHVGGFFFIKHPLDILRNFIFYFLWLERCRMHSNAQ